MFPHFSLFGRDIPLYGLMAMVGALLAGWYACRRARKAGLDDNDMLSMLIAAFAGALAGGHLLYGLTMLGSAPMLWAATEADNLPLRIAGFLAHLFGGAVFYGGLIGGIAAALLYSRAKKRPFAPYAQVAAVAIPLFHAFGRVGCFLAGCCYGVPSRIGFTYTHAVVSSANHVSRFPVQLVEAAINFGLFALLHALSRREGSRGKLLALYLAAYALIRFVLEFWRGDAVRGHIGVLSTSQFISIGMLMFAVAWQAIARLRRTRRGGNGNLGAA